MPTATITTPRPIHSDASLSLTLRGTDTVTTVANPATSGAIGTTSNPSNPPNPPQSTRQSGRGSFAIDCEQGTTDQGALVESPSIGLVYQIFIGILSMITPALVVTYAVTGSSVIFGMGLTTAPLCLSCVGLCVVSSPSTQEREMVALPITWAVLTFGGAGIGHLFTDKYGVDVLGLMCLAGCVILPVVVVKFVLPIRRKLGAIGRDKLKTYVYGTVFVQGFGALPPMLYLSIESVKCLFDNRDIQGDIFEVCGGIIVPQFSICVMFAGFHAARLFILPLTDLVVTMEEIARFPGLGLRLKCQMIAVLLVVFCNTILFGLMDKGRVTVMIWILTGIAVGSLFTLVFVELAHVAKQQQQQGRRQGRVSRHQNDLGEVLATMERGGSGDTFGDIGVV